MYANTDKMKTVKGKTSFWVLKNCQLVRCAYLTFKVFKFHSYVNPQLMQKL